MTFEAGSRVGPYEIRHPIGAGGMGEVYRAHDPRLGRDVAIKVVSGLSDRDRLDRFEREARAAASLSHPNVLSIFDIGVGERPFLVTELLEGETLRAVIARGPLPIGRALDLVLQLIAGLRAAHTRGVIHRDLKPENLFLTTGGILKILDFGLAKVEPGAGDLTATGLTAAGVVLGTIGYMSPEQVRGQDADARSDLFACGAIFYELLTSKPAFAGASPADRLAAVLHQSAAALPFPAETPAAVIRVIQRCLERDPEARFQSAQELASALESLSDTRWQAAPAPASVEHRSIAVLPFANLSADPANQYFSDGLAEDLTSALSELSGLQVAAPTSSFRFRGRAADVREIGRDLGVATILDGSVRRSEGRLRITTRLVDAATGYQLWSSRYDREPVDVFDVQDEIVHAIVQAIAPSLVPADREFARRGTRNLEAYELYLKGRHLWNQRSPAVLQAALRHFEEAVARDPEYALPYCGLADGFTILHVYGLMPPAACRPRAEAAVARALSLEPGLPEAHLSRALYQFHFERNWRQARQAFLDALQARPRMASAHAQLGLFFATAGEVTAARESIGRALELDPHGAAIHFLAASMACLTGDFEVAERHAGRSLELQPDSLGARWPQTIALLALGRTAEALAIGDLVLARSRAPIYLGVMAMVCGCAGRIAEARRLGQELDERACRGEFIVPIAYLALQLGLRHPEGVREALSKCVDGGAAPMAVLGPTRFLLEGYRKDPEIRSLLDRLEDRVPQPDNGPPDDPAGAPIPRVES